jgi:hypothetical protein
MKLKRKRWANFLRKYVQQEPKEYGLKKVHFSKLAARKL